MGDWIWCTNCGHLVPHYEKCDMCYAKLPIDDVQSSDNTGTYFGVCDVCGESVEDEKSPYGSGCSKCNQR